MTNAMQFECMRKALMICPAALLALGACSTSQPLPTDVPARALTLELQRLDRFARVEHQGSHVLRITLHDRSRAEPSRAELESLAGIAAGVAFRRGSVSKGDSVVVVLTRPKRLGPLIWDGSLTRFTFTSPPAPPPDARRFQAPAA